jgi:hypothetical protein
MVNKDFSSCEISSGAARGTPSKSEGKNISPGPNLQLWGPILKRIIIFIDFTKSIGLTVFMTNFLFTAY